MNSYKQNSRFLKKQFLLFISLRAKTKGVKIEYNTNTNAVQMRMTRLIYTRLNKTMEL